jgi:hypothetical protein
MNYLVPFLFMMEGLPQDTALNEAFNDPKRQTPRRGFQRFV